jgi:cell filamentation protein
MIDFYFDVKNGVLKNKLNIVDYHQLKVAESYFFNLGLNRLQEKRCFSTDPEFLSYVHNYLFNSLYDWAGKYRLIDMERSEPALAGLSVKYFHYEDIATNVGSVFRDIKRVNLNDLAPDEKLDYISDVVVKLWHIHPFRDCNTRTLVTFINQYCGASSLSLDVDVLRYNIEYFRRSLVASAFEDKELDVEQNKSYTLRIMKDAFRDNFKK